MQTKATSIWHDSHCKDLKTKIIQDATGDIMILMYEEDGVRLERVLAMEKWIYNQITVLSLLFPTKTNLPVENEIVDSELRNVSLP